MADETPEFEPEKVTNLFERKPQQPPRDDGSSRASTPKRRGRPNKHDERKQKLFQLLSTVGAGVSFFEQYDGAVILQNAEQVAEATATLADESAQVAKAIDAMSTGGAWGGFAIALCAMVIPILVHHKLVPPFLSAVLAPVDTVDRQENAG